MSISSVSQPPLAASDINVKDYLDIIRRRKVIFIQVFVMVLVVGVMVTALQKPVYQTRAKITVAMQSNSVSINSSDNPIAPLMSLIQPDRLDAQLQVLQSGPFIDDAKKKAGVVKRAGVPPPTVTVAAQEGTGGVIQIGVEGGDPQEIARLANAMVEQHMERTELLSTNNLTRAMEFVRKERDKAAKALADAEGALLTFKKRNKVVQLAAETEARSKEYIDLKSRINEADSNITTTAAQVKELQARLDKMPLELTDVRVEPNLRIGKYQEKLDDLKLQAVDLARDYKPESKRMMALKAQIAELEAQLKNEKPEIRTESKRPNPAREPLQLKLSELEASLQGYQAEKNASAAKFDTRKGLVDNLGPWEVQLGKLTRERDAAQEAEKMFSTRLRDLEIRSQIKIPMARLVEPASVPSEPVRPKKSTNLMLSAVLGLCLAAGMAFLQEYMDDRVNSPDDLERISALSTLGHVPLMAGETQPLLSSLPANSHVSEAYRALRSAVGFAGIDAPIRRLLVTSASKGEGKSVTSVNLATAMAMDGKRVILVDADMRRPSMHRLLNLPNSPGLSEVLVGLKTVDEALQETDVDNLRAIAAGPIPPNPAELLGSEAFDRIMEQLSERADLVIFDSPPCMPVTDPLIIASRMDGVVLVLHSGTTRKGAIKHAEALLTRARARIVGVVFNRIQQAKSGYYYHHYYYYYGDGYYADAAEKGEQHRNGKRRKPELNSGRAMTVSSRSEDDD